MLRFVELADGTYRLTYVKDGNPSISYEGRFMSIENDSSIPEADKPFKIEIRDDEK